MAKTLMDMIFGGGQEPAFGSFATPGGSAAPRPAPASMRPPAPGMPDNRRLGERWGWGDNPLYRIWDAASDSGLIEDLGYGLLKGHDLGEALELAGTRGLEMAPQRRATREEEEQRRKYAETIGSWGPEYADFAAGIADGAFEPADGYWKALQYEELARARGNAQFIADPQLRSMVEAGAMSFSDAYRYQVDGAASGGMPGLGSTIYTGRDENGNIIPMQVGDNGQFYPTQLPDGVNFDPGALNAERAAGGKYGSGVGQAAFDLPTIEAQTEFAINNLNNLIYQTDQSGQVATDRLGRPMPNQGMQEQFGTGWFGLPTGQMLPAIPNTEKANFQARRDQVQGQAFLQAIESLKGSGAISEVEGLKATQAIIRAQTSQTEAEFVKAIQEAITVYERGLENARQQAAGTQFTGGAGQRPAVGGGQYAINPQTGERLMLQGGQWVPAQ